MHSQCSAAPTEKANKMRGVAKATHDDRYCSTAGGESYLKNSWVSRLTSEEAHQQTHHNRFFYSSVFRNEAAQQKPGSYFFLKDKLLVLANSI